MEFALLGRCYLLSVGRFPAYANYLALVSTSYEIDVHPSLELGIPVVL